MRSTDPIRVFEAAVEALRNEDWAALVATCDPESVSVFTDELLTGFRRVDIEPAISVEAYLKGAPDLSPEEAQRHLDEARTRRLPENRVADEYPSVASVQDLLRLPANEVLAAWLYGRSPRAALARQVSQSRTSRVLSEEDVAGIAQMWEYRALGVITDEDICHVVYRGQQPADATSETDKDSDRYHREHPQILTMRRAADGQWGVLANTQMFGLGSWMYVFELDEPTAADG
jgi:hypothetical protein